MDPRLVAISRKHGGLFTAAHARSVGYSPNEIGHLVRSGAWAAVRRGVYCDEAAWADAPPGSFERHRLVVAAALLATNVPSAASHLTAAALLDLPLIRPLPELPQITSNREHRRPTAGVHVYSARMPEHHVCLVGIDELRVTNVARTLSDVARTYPMADALVMADAATRNDYSVLGALSRTIVDCPTWRGISRAKRLLQLIDARSESPGESLSRLRMLEHDIELPELQAEVTSNDRHYRLDFLWESRGVVGEFDGRLKYEGGAADALWLEKRREDDLRSDGFVVARWTWDDVRGDGLHMAMAIRKAWALAAQSPHRPRVRRLSVG